MTTCVTHYFSTQGNAREKAGTDTLPGSSSIAAAAEDELDEDDAVTDGLPAPTAGAKNDCILIMRLSLPLVYTRA